MFAMVFSQIKMNGFCSPCVVLAVPVSLANLRKTNDFNGDEPADLALQLGVLVAGLRGFGTLRVPFASRADTRGRSVTTDLRVRQRLQRASDHTSSTHAGLDASGSGELLPRDIFVMSGSPPPPALSLSMPTLLSSR